MDRLNDGREFDARSDLIASVIVVAIVLASALCGALAMDVDSETPPPPERSLTQLATAE